MRVNNPKYEIRNLQRGFTLVETIVSLGILMLGIGASLTLVTATVSYSKQTESLIVVVNLAREGLEIVRAIRDVGGFDALPGGDTSWIIDRTSTALATAATFSGGTDNNARTNFTIYFNNNQHLPPPR